jgi:hypothetical protein
MAGWPSFLRFPEHREPAAAPTPTGGTQNTNQRISNSQHSGRLTVRDW